MELLKDAYSYSQEHHLFLATLVSGPERPLAIPSAANSIVSLFL